MQRRPVDILWVVLIVLLDSCALEQTMIVASGDLACTHDQDCVIVNECGTTKPYAMSRAAASPMRCNDILYDCSYEATDWVAVCSDHVCKSRLACCFRSPEPHCSNR